MNVVRCSCVAEASPADVLRVMRDLASWPSWVPGMLEHGVPVPGEVRCVLQGPVPVRLHLQISECDGGVAFSMVEGDLSDIHGTATVEDGGGGTARVDWRLTVAAPVTIPAALWRELEQQTLPRWTAALGAVAARQLAE